MNEQLTDNEIAKLHAKFIVPIVVDRMLHDEEELDDVAEYALNQIIDELQPDTALLCIAMCTQRIAAQLSHLGIGKILAIRANHIVQEYGPIWLAHEQQQIILSNREVREILNHIPEDLEMLADLLDSVIDTLDEYHSIQAVLCDILSIQARIHKENAEMELQQLTREFAPHAQVRKFEDNVIEFPLHLVRKKKEIETTSA